MEDFVTFEIAKKLKEKGFDYPCIGHYVNNQLYVAHYQNAFHSDNDESVDAPTISQVLKWLRDEKGTHINVVIWEEGWYVDVWVYEFDEAEKEYSTQFRHQSDNYKSYEQAALVGIKYVLDNLI